jgi:hypothetical protein
MVTCIFILTLEHLRHLIINIIRYFIETMLLVEPHRAHVHLMLVQLPEEQQGILFI